MRIWCLSISCVCTAYVRIVCCAPAKRCGFVEYGYGSTRTRFKYFDILIHICMHACTNDAVTCYILAYYESSPFGDRAYASIRVFMYYTGSTPPIASAILISFARIVFARRLSGPLTDRTMLFNHVACVGGSPSWTHSAQFSLVTTPAHTHALTEFSSFHSADPDPSQHCCSLLLRWPLRCSAATVGWRWCAAIVAMASRLPVAPAVWPRRTGSCTTAPPHTLRRTRPQSTS